MEKLKRIVTSYGLQVTRYELTPLQLESHDLRQNWAVIAGHKGQNVWRHYFFYNRFRAGQEIKNPSFFPTSLQFNRLNLKKT
jgi:hypothetical protein